MKSKKNLKIQKYSMFMNRKTQYCQDVSSFQFELYIKCNSNQKLNMLFYGDQQNNSKV